MHTGVPVRRDTLHFRTVSQKIRYITTRFRARVPHSLCVPKVPLRPTGRIMEKGEKKKWIFNRRDDWSEL